MAEMEHNIAQYIGDALSRSVVVDVGSRDINGSYRGLVEGCKDYVGVDVEEGSNVDLVMPSEFSIPLPDGFADLVMCGQVLEHCSNPFKLVAEVARVMSRGAYLFLCAPMIWPLHRYPLDAWRFLPDGMRCLAVGAGLEHVRGYISDMVEWRRLSDPNITIPLVYVGDSVNLGVDCWGISRKP